jgi:hypothetical protein
MVKYRESLEDGGLDKSEKSVILERSGTFVKRTSLLTKKYEVFPLAEPFRRVAEGALYSKSALSV